MKAAVIYSSKHGTTEKVARLIGDKLNNYSIEYFNLRNKARIDLSDFSIIIIGSSIYGGRNQPEVRRFIKNNILKLLQVKIGLFLCCLNQMLEESEFDSAYPELLRNHSVYNAIIGGELLVGKMSLFERYLVRKTSGISSTLSMLRYPEIEKLANSVKLETDI